MTDPTRPIPLLAVFPREYRVMSEDVRENLRKPSGYVVTEDCRIFDEMGHQVPVRKRYSGRDWAVLCMHDTDSQLARDVAWGRVIL